MNAKKSNNFPRDKYKFLLVNRDNLSDKYYRNIIAYDLILKQNYVNIMQLARIDKIILNTTSKIYIQDKKYILFTLAGLELISGQKAQLTYAKKSIANFKVRQRQIIGSKVILRENQLYSFLDKLSKIIIPRVRDFSRDNLTIQRNKTSCLTSKINSTNFTKLSTHTFGFQNMMIFPELENHFELVDNFRGMNLTFVVSKSDKNVCSLLLSGFQLPIFA